MLLRHTVLAHFVSVIVKHPPGCMHVEGQLNRALCYFWQAMKVKLSSVKPAAGSADSVHFV